MEKKHTHLQMIQGVVNRLSQNSFFLKGWSVVLVSALLAVSAQAKNLDFVILAFIPAIAFWLLDGYFLWQERLFRALYDKVRVMEEDQIDFSMDVSAVKSRVHYLARVVFSKTLLLFHGTLIAAIMIVVIIKYPK